MSARKCCNFVDSSGALVILWLCAGAVVWASSGEPERLRFPVVAEGCGGDDEVAGSERVAIVGE